MFKTRTRKSNLVALMLAAAISAATLIAQPLAALADAPKPLADGIFVTGQMAPGAVTQLPGAGYKSVINLRPDGEAVFQPSGAQMSAAATTVGIGYAHVPTKSADITDQEAADFARELEKSPKPVLVYCRSGSRAARQWALAEASRPGGKSAAEINAAVKAVGQSADDLMPRIQGRIAGRAAQPANK